MDAIVLAAGRGTRMAPICTRRPKPLLPLAGRSVLERMLDGLREAGVERAVVVTEHQAQAVEDAVGGREDVACVRQGEPHGTGHAVAVGAEHVEGDALVVVADCVADGATLASLAGSRGFAMAVADVERPERFGVVDVQDGRVAGLAEKPTAAASNTVNTGLYRVPAEALAQCASLRPSPRGELEFTDVVAGWIDEGVSAHRAAAWHDLGTPWDYLAAHEAVLPGAMGVAAGETGGPGTVEDGVEVRGRIWVGEGAVVRSGTYVEGDAWVAAGADVGPNAYLRGPVTVGGGARVGAASEIKASILLDGAQAPHHNYVGDSVLGQGCNLGSGTKLANLRLDDATVRVDWDGTVVDTGRRKFGAVIGDGARTGVNASLMPGTVLDAGAWLHAGAVGKGWVARKPD